MARARRCPQQAGAPITNACGSGTQDVRELDCVAIPENDRLVVDDRVPGGELPGMSCMSTRVPSAVALDGQKHDLRAPFTTY
jgi:hypothetical protein